MAFVSERLGKWMPGDKPLGVNSRPRLSGVMYTINATHAHGSRIRHPGEFYDERIRSVINRIVIDENSHGYSVSREMRMLGVGEVLRVMVQGMADRVEWDNNPGDEDSSVRARAPFRMPVLRCHDATIGATLASLGCFGGDERWPSFTSHVIFELFHQKAVPSLGTDEGKKPVDATSLGIACQGDDKPQDTMRRSVEKLTTERRRSLDGYFVRVKYNGRVMTISGCREEGKHLEGNESLCTLVSLLAPPLPRSPTSPGDARRTVYSILFTDSFTHEHQSAFKSIVGKFTPRNWRDACGSNLGAPTTAVKDEPAGY